MTDSNDFYNSFDNYWGKEKQEPEPVQFDSGPTKFRTLYMIVIAEIILVAGGIIGALLEAYTLVQISSLAMLVAGIAYLVVVLKLREYNDLFRVAGLYYLSKTLIDFFNNNFNVEPFHNLLEILVAVLGVLYIVKFCDGCVQLLKDQDKIITDSWLSFRYGYVCYSVASIVCSLLAYIPIIRVLVVIASIILAVFTIVFFVWQLRLLKRTDIVLRGGTI